MAATRRLTKEYWDLRLKPNPVLRDVEMDGPYVLLWTGNLVPDKPPYNKGNFKIEINFNTDYPFKPPKVMFITKIYHPNIDEEGDVRLLTISAENWKPVTKPDQVVQVRTRKRPRGGEPT